MCICLYVCIYAHRSARIQMCVSRLNPCYAEECRENNKEEIKATSCDVDQSQGRVCQQCVQRHMGMISSGLLPGSTCTAAKVAKFCHSGHLIAQVQGTVASDSCSMEIQANWKQCKMDKVKNLGVKCLSCVNRHRSAINSGLVSFLVLNAGAIGG